MGKKSRRRDRHREEREEDLEERRKDIDAGIVEFSTEDLVARMGMEELQLSDLGLFVHPAPLRRILDWTKVMATAREAGHADPTRCGVISFKSNGKTIRLVFSNCLPGHPAALLSPYEAEVLDATTRAPSSGGREQSVRGCASF